MPISMPLETRRISQKEFGDIAFEVMRHSFAIHDEFGRFFNEGIYKRELAARMDSVLLELPITVSFQGFQKTYRIDALEGLSSLFEYKCVDAIIGRHRSQTMNYLLLADLAHAKIINMRPEQVEHEFVNCSFRLCDTRNPEIVTNHWQHSDPAAVLFRELLQSIISDWGCGLELNLYEEALSHFLLGDTNIDVQGIKKLGVQSMRLVDQEVAFKLTAFKEPNQKFATHAKRLLDHTDLRAIFWANLRPDSNSFQLIT